MKPARTLSQSSLIILIVSTLSIYFHVYSNNAYLPTQIVSTHVAFIDISENDKPVHGLPTQSKKQEDESKDKSYATKKHHSEEEKHKHHFYDYDKAKKRKGFCKLLFSWFMRSIVAISYLSVLLCTFINLSH